MTLVKWTPRKPMVSIFDDMDKMFGQFFSNGEILKNDANWVPVFDVREAEENYTLTTDLPGITKKDINIKVNDGLLTVSGLRNSEKSAENDTWHCNEIQYGNFSRSFNLPETVNEEKIKANFKNGVLTLTIPKIEPIAPEVKKIAIT